MELFESLAVGFGPTGKSAVVDGNVSAVLGEGHRRHRRGLRIETEARELELFDHPMRKMGHGMRYGTPVPVRELMTGCKSAGAAAALDDEHAMPGAAEIRGTDQAVVACTDNDGVVSRHGLMASEKEIAQVFGDVRGRSSLPTG